MFKTHRVFYNYFKKVDSKVKSLETISAAGDDNQFRGGLVVFDGEGIEVFRHVESDMSGDPCDIGRIEEVVGKMG